MVNEKVEMEIETISESTSSSEDKTKSTPKVYSITDALKKLREEKKRKFLQTVELIINLQRFDPRKQGLNTFISIPHAPEKKLCAFLTKKSPIIKTITLEEFDNYKNNKDIKKLSKNYDGFIAVASLMPKVATKFGRVLGPIGKMPSPQGGIIPAETDDAVAKMVEKMKQAIKIRTKENSIKLKIGKEDLTDKDLEENILAAVNSIKNLLPEQGNNIKNVLIKFSMTPVLEVKY